MRLKTLVWMALVGAAIDGGCSCNGGGRAGADASTDGMVDGSKMDGAGTHGADMRPDVADTGTDVADVGGTDVGGTDVADAGTDVADAGTDASDAGSDVAACTPGGACTTNLHAPCRTGVIQCSGSTPQCADDTVLADGTPCQDGICTRGFCYSPSTISASTNLTTTSVTLGRSCPEAPQYSVASLAADSATLTMTNQCLVIGDEMLLINLQGAPGAIANVGNWELVTIAGITGSTVRFAAAKTKSYGAAAGSDAGIGTGATDQKVSLIRVPQFGSLTLIGDNSLTAAPWDGTKGGVVVLRAASLTVRGTITAAGLGYRGGRWSRDTDACADSVATEAGESIDGPGAAGTANNIGGAGGLSAATAALFASNSPLQSGAGHAQPGGMGSNGGVRTVGPPGTTYGVNDASKLTLGSGAGGNLTCELGFPGPALVTREESLAGGIVLLLAQTLQVETGGAITASATTASRDVSASGGYVFIRGGTLGLGTGQVTAIGGTGTGINGPTQGMSVKAGDGYVVVQGTTVTGTTTPAASRL